MKIFFAKFYLIDASKNEYKLKTFANLESGEITYSGLHLSNLQIGWKYEAELPDNIWEYDSTTDIFAMICNAVDSGVKRVIHARLLKPIYKGE